MLTRPLLTRSNNPLGLSAQCLNSGRLFIVDDDESFRRVIAARLRLRGYSIAVADDALHALQHLEQVPYDLVLLDLSLPHRQAIAVLGQIREISPVPVMMITACDQLQDRITALQAGADDYLTKPISLVELEARIRCLLRRSLGAYRGGFRVDGLLKMGELMIDDLTINFRKRQVERGCKKTTLTETEASILEVLIAANGLPLSRHEMVRRVWGERSEQCQRLRLVDGHVVNLRRKLEANPGQPRLILTKRGVGYQFCELERERSTRVRVAGR